MQNRIQQARINLLKENIDAVLFTSSDNIRYYTGLAGLSDHEREAFLVISKHHIYLLTFPTYFDMFSEIRTGMEIRNITYDKKLHSHLQEIIIKENINRFGFENNDMTCFERDSLENKLNLTFIPITGFTQLLREIKDDKEIRSIQKAAQITDKTFDFIKTKIIPGISEKKIAVEIEYFIKSQTDDIAFTPIVAFNEHASIPHYLSNPNSKLTKNSLILLDFGAKYNGYCSDMTRIIFFNNPSNKLVKAYNAVRKAQESAISLLKPGIRAYEIDKVCRNIIKSQGYPEFLHGTGHGVGINIHENPRLNPNSEAQLERNMVFTVEPGIYIPKQFGIRIEDLVVLRNNGPELLSKTTKDITIIN
jgi:Xaa-Pro aminopeptidase